MSTLFIKKGWALALLAHGLYILTTLWSSYLAMVSTTGYLAKHCTEYCEFHGCQHGNRFAAFYPLVTAQVTGLYGLAHTLTGTKNAAAYQAVNLLVYIVIIGGLLLACGLYLVSSQAGRRAPIKLGEWVATSLLLPTMLIYTPPGTRRGVFLSAVDLCLGVGYLTHYTLYEVYTLGFVFVGPALVALVVLATVVKRFTLWGSR